MVCQVARFYETITLVIRILLFVFFCFGSLKLNAGFFSNLSSPITTNARYFLLPGSVVALGIHSFENSKLSYEAKQELYHEATPTQRQYAHWGDFLGSGVLNGAYFISQILSGNSDNAWHIFNATLHTAIVTWGLKYSVHEKRPSGTNYLSFPSGHTSNAFAFASVAAINHSWPIGVMSIAIASFVGYSRIVDNAHWLHDVVAGMVLGTSYGIGIYLNSQSSSKVSQLEKSYNKEKENRFSFMLVPIPKSYIPGLQINFLF